MRVHADFNSRCAGGHVFALREEFPDVIPEETLTLYDAEGNEAEGFIADIDNELVHVSVDWGTWRPFGPEGEPRG